MQPTDKRREQVDAIEAFLTDAMGEAGFLDALTRALDYDTKRDAYAYILRVYDLDDAYKKSTQ